MAWRLVGAKPLAIIWTNAGILSIGPLGTNFSGILSEINVFSFKKMHLKCHLRNGPQWVYGTLLSTNGFSSMCQLSVEKLQKIEIWFFYCLRKIQQKCTYICMSMKTHSSAGVVLARQAYLEVCCTPAHQNTSRDWYWSITSNGDTYIRHLYTPLQANIIFSQETKWYNRLVKKRVLYSMTVITKCCNTV